MTPAEEVARRLERFRRATDGTTRLVHGRPNVRYLTGYDGGGVTPWLLIGDDAVAAVFYTADQESVEALSTLELDLFPFAPTDDLFDVLRSTIKSWNGGGHRLVGDIDWWSTQESAHVDTALENASDALRALRVVKSEWEQEQLRAAGAVTSTTMDHLEGLATAGASPRELAGAFFSKAIELGSDSFTYIPYLAVGDATYLNHTTWDWAKLWGGADARGDAYLFEFATNSNGYGTPLSRSRCEDHAAQRALSAIERAVAAIREQLRPGADPRELHSVMAAEIEAAGFSFAHRAGYSIGLGEPETWMEGSLAQLGPQADYRIAEGMAFHVVGSVVEAGRFGVARSNSLLVTADGSEVLAA
jgi:Xaa-Pro aminopeptidase/Xaa-Pro dipeptidase